MKPHQLTCEDTMLSDSTRPPHPERRIMALEVRNLCGGVSDMWLHRRMRDSDFPRPIKISGRRFWREEEVIAWLKKQDLA